MAGWNGEKERNLEKERHQSFFRAVRKPEEKHKRTKRELRC